MNQAVWVLFTAFACGAAAADEIARPPVPSYELGDAFVFDDGRVEQVAQVDGDVVTWSGLQGGPYQRRRNFITPVMGWRNDQGEGRRNVSGPADALWPLKPGRSVRFSVITESHAAGAKRWERNLALWVCKVDTTTEIDVPAGRYAVNPITCDRFSPVNMRLQERVTWDYSPEIGHYVRRTIIDYFAARTSVIALSSALHGAAATRPRLMTLSAQARARSAR